MKKAKNTFLAVMAIAVILVIVVIGRSSVAPSQEDERTPIRIGAILMLSGMGADWGENSQKGIDLAIREINANGGILGRSVEIGYQDNKGDNPAEAISAFRNLQAQGVRLIIGPNWTPSGTALAPLIKDHNAIMISPSLGSDKFAMASPNTFNIWPPDRDGTRALAAYVFEKGVKKVAIFGSKQEWEHDQSLFFKERFEEIGGTIVAMELPIADNKDLRTESAKIAEANPDAVIFTNYGEMSIASLRLRQMGVKSPFFAVLLDEQNIDQANGALDGTEFVTFQSPTREFAVKFEAAYGKPPRVPADTAYDSVYMFAEAIKRAGSTDVSRVQKELGGIRAWTGASGTFAMDEFGVASKSPLFYKVKGAEMVKIK